MKVSSVRLNAFATNSSSVHTPVILSPKSPEAYFNEAVGFNGDFFLKTYRDKRLYMASLLYSALGIMPHEMKVSVVHSWTRFLNFKDVPEDQLKIPIDYNAPKNLPKAYGTTYIDKEFFTELYQWIMNPNMGILAYRDESGYPKKTKTKSIKWAHEECYQSDGAWVSRKDPKGYWCLFNSLNGTKLRVSFNDNIDMSKSTVPELVDLKITNKCNNGCTYCYQNSTPNGVHGNYFKIWEILGKLKDFKVLEVAIGGGEPTLHPDFWNIIKDASGYGIKPNFSTRNLKWCEEPNKVKIFKDCCGAFAYSVDSKYDVEVLGKTLIKYDLYDETNYMHSWATVQYVVSSGTTQEDLMGIAEECCKWRVPLTLLGFKSVGRAKDQKFGPPKINWEKLLKTYVDLGIDTCMAKAYSKELNQARIKKWSIQIKEGAHSMYIDAVSNKMGASSYCEKMESLNLNKLAEKFGQY